jgi:hypothetical protein
VLMVVVVVEVVLSVAEVNSDSEHASDLARILLLAVLLFYPIPSISAVKSQDFKTFLSQVSAVPSQLGQRRLLPGNHLFG